MKVQYHPTEHGPQSQGTQVVALNPSVVVPNDQLIEPSKRITKIMTSFKVLPNQDMTNQNIKILGTEKALNKYLSSLPQEVYSSIENRCQSYTCIGAPSGRSHSTTRRKNTDEKGLFLCLWYGETITTKNNVANHICSHSSLIL
ncbi:hypothetical protein BJ165DRAFT_1524796 [Panaeolus papilionaceus]|nr:hypothetical protein BJ165DRAFT_1524796 [Panaeolus papilionaceus]